MEGKFALGGCGGGLSTDGVGKFVHACGCTFEFMQTEDMQAHHVGALLCKVTQFVCLFVGLVLSTCRTHRFFIPDPFWPAQSLNNPYIYSASRVLAA